MNKNEAIFWGVILLIFAPSVLFGLFFEFLPFIIVIGAAILIIKFGKNGFMVFTGLGALSSFVGIFLSFVKEGTTLYVKTEAAGNIVSLFTMESLIDFILFAESINWSTWEHLIAFIFYSVLTYSISKF